MAHKQQQDFISSIKKKFPSYFNGTKVLEIGSLDVNGTIRHNFTDCEYIGLDVGEGPCVDIVCYGEKYDAPDSTFDITISTECFEHTSEWTAIFRNMVRMTKPNGLIIVTCAGPGRAEHGTPYSHPHASPLTVQKGSDYYQNVSKEEFLDVLDFNKAFSDFYCEEINIEMEDLQFWGIKS